MPDKGLMLAEPRTLTEGADVRQLAHRWLDSLALRVRAGELSETTKRTHQIGLEKFLTWTDRRKVVSDEVIREWIADLRDEGRTPTTINTWLARVRSFFAWASGWSSRPGRVPIDPNSSGC